LAASGPYITVVPGSVRPLHTYSAIRVLPIDLPSSALTVAIVTLKNRVLNPIAHRFIEHLRTEAAANSGRIDLPEVAVNRI